MPRPPCFELRSVGRPERLKPTTSQRPREARAIGREGVDGPLDPKRDAVTSGRPRDAVVVPPAKCHVVRQDLAGVGPVCVHDRHTVVAVASARDVHDPRPIRREADSLQAVKLEEHFGWTTIDVDRDEKPGIPGAIDGGDTKKTLARLVAVSNGRAQ